MIFLIYNSLTKSYNVLREMEFKTLKEDIVSLLEVFDIRQENLAKKICYNLNVASEVEPSLVRA